MNHSESVETLAEALAKAQLAFLPVKQTEKVDYATASGRKKYSYAPLSAVLDACRKALSDNGLAIIQMPANDNEKIIIETVLLHKSGQWVSSVLGLKPVNYDPQSIGSLITYLRRYSLSSLLGIASEEDDDATGLKPTVIGKPAISPNAPLSLQDKQETERKAEIVKLSETMAGEPEKGVESGPGESSKKVNMDDLKQLLTDIQWAQIDVQKYVFHHFKATGKNGWDAVLKLNPEQLYEFAQEVEKRRAGK